MECGGGLTPLFSARPTVAILITCGYNRISLLDFYESNVMPNPTVTIPLDPQTTRAYDDASPEEKRKIQVLLGLWLRELASGEQQSLDQLLDELGRKAQSRGLTPEISDSLLEGT